MFLEYEAKKSKLDENLEDAGSEADELQSPSKIVKFAEEEEEEKPAASKVEKKGFTIPPDQARALHKQLAVEFVKSKQQKLSYSVRFYIWLNKTFTEQIMFKNKEEVLKELV